MVLEELENYLFIFQNHRVGAMALHPMQVAVIG
jgi:hypothetical protein